MGALSASFCTPDTTTRSPLLDAGEHGVVVADDRPDRDRTLFRDELAAGVFGDEREDLPVQPQHRGDRHDESGRRLPDEARAHVLSGAQRAVGVPDRALDEHRLRLVVHASRDVADRRLGQRLLAVARQDLDRQLPLQLARAFDRHRHVQFERRVLVDRRERRRRRHLIADAHRDVADHAVGRRGDGVVAELHLLLLHLRVERLQIRLGRLARRLGLLELLLADRAGLVELLRALLLLAGVVHIRLLQLALGFLARDGRALASRIDLEERRARPDPLAGPDGDLRDLPLDLGLHRRRSQRFQRRDVFARVLDRRGAGDSDLDRRGRKGHAARRRPLLTFAAANRRHERRGDRDPVQAHSVFDSQRWSLVPGQNRKCTTLMHQHDLLDLDGPHAGVLSEGIERRDFLLEHLQGRRERRPRGVELGRARLERTGDRRPVVVDGVAQRHVLVDRARS